MWLLDTGTQPDTTTKKGRLRQLREIVPRLRITLVQIGRIFGLLWRANRRYVLILAWLPIIEGLVPLAQLWIAKLIFDHLSLSLTARATGQPPPDSAPLVWLIGAELAVSLIGPVSATFQQMIEGILGQQVVFRINEQLIETALRLDLDFFERAEFYDKLKLATDEASYRPVNMLLQTLTIIASLITFVSLLGLLIFISPLVLLLFFALAIPALAVQADYINAAFFLARLQAPETRRMALNQFLTTRAEWAKEIRIFGLGGYFLDEFRRLFWQTHTKSAVLLKRQSLRKAVVESLSVLGYMAVYAYLVLQAVDGRLTIGDLTAFTGAVLQGQGAFERVLSQTARLYEGARYLDNLFDFLALKPRMPARATHALPAPIRDGLRVEGVGFQYVGKDTPVLHDINVEVKPGETIALVGENGAGKTTLIKLLCRLYDPTAGRVTLDGVDLRDLDPDGLRDLIGVIFQDYARYNLTVRENIGVGRVSALDDVARIERAAAAGGAAEVVAELPQGYATMLGVLFEDGTELSGGQWQRIALARAMMRDAQIVILDEPTAALDARAEAEIFQRFRDMTQGKMTILISHRFSTVRAADRIYVLESGRVTERGSHAELMARGGHYADLFNLQAAGYQ